MSNLKKIFLYVTGTGSNNSFKEAVIAKSAEADFNDKIFFLVDSQEIVTHGQIFGASSDEIAKINADIVALKGDVVKLVGLETYGEFTEIKDDATKSVIAKFVHAHMSKVSNADDSIVVTPSEVSAEGINYAIKVDTEAIVDGDSILGTNGKIKSNIELVLMHQLEDGTFKEHEDGDNVEPDYDAITKPFLVLRTKNNKTVISEFDVSEFVTDGMIKDVAYEETTGDIIFTWNSDAGEKSTRVNVKQFFNIEEIKSLNGYIDVTKGNTEEGAYYSVEAKVSNVDLSGTGSATSSNKTLDIEKNTDGNYVVVKDDDLAHQNTIGNIKDTELADAKLTAKKFENISNKIVEIANDLISADNTNKEELTNAITTETERATNAEQANADAITAEVNRATAAEQANADAITAEVENRQAAISGLNAEVVGQDPTEGKALAEVSLKQEAGIVTKLGINLSTNTIGYVGDSVVEGATAYPIKNGDNVINYYVKTVDTVAGEEPALMTTQDAWLYGQAMCVKAINSIQDDRNKYIHIEYDPETQTPKVEFEPWATISSVSELEQFVHYEKDETNTFDPNK